MHDNSTVTAEQLSFPVRPVIIGIAGCSGSGKTTLARELTEQLSATLLPLDYYYICLSHLPPEDRALQNFDHPDSLEHSLLVTHIEELADRRTRPRDGAIGLEVHDELARVRDHRVALCLGARIRERDRSCVAGALRASPAEAPERVAALQDDNRKLQRQVTELQHKLATGGGGSEVEEVNGVRLAARNLGEVPARDLKGLADAIGKQLGSGVVALVSTAEGKASIVVGVSADLTGRINAVQLVRAASAAVGGKGGGGRPDMAQAGGPDGARADAALAAVRRALAV